MVETESISGERSSSESRRRITSAPRRDISVTNMYLPPQASYPVCMRQCTQRQAARLKYTAWRTHRVPTATNAIHEETERELVHRFLGGLLSLTNQRTRWFLPLGRSDLHARLRVHPPSDVRESHPRRVSKIARESELLNYSLVNCWQRITFVDHDVRTSTFYANIKCTFVVCVLLK